MTEIGSHNVTNQVQAGEGASGSTFGPPLRDDVVFEALPSGTRLSGITVLTEDTAGEIAHIAIDHRPLDAALEFSREMGRRTAEGLGPGYFYDS